MPPPARGPRQLTAAATPATRPSAAARTAPWKRKLMMATPSVGTAAAPAPWKIRAASSTGNTGASDPTSAPAVISPTPTSSGSRMPTRSETRP